jgi:hypothetical protein
MTSKQPATDNGEYNLKPAADPVLVKVSLSRDGVNARDGHSCTSLTVPAMPITLV